VEETGENPHDHNRKAKFDFRIYHFFHSGVMALDLPKKKNRFILAVSMVICVLCTHFLALVT
jgi:hypothetical protein